MTRDAVAALLKALFRAEAAVAVTAFLVVVVVLLADLLGREFFGHGIFWAPRLATYCTTTAGMLGFSLLISTGGHLRPRNLDGLAPAAWRPVIERLGHVLSAIVCLWLAWYSSVYVAESFRHGTRGMGIEVAIWPMQLIIPYVFVSGALRYLAYGWQPALAPREGMHP